MSASTEEFHAAHRAKLEALVEAAHEAARERLIISTSGNISTRLDENHFAISAARTRLGALALEDLVLLPMAPAASDSDGRRPSRETPFHRALYQSYPELRCVLHFQSLAGTALACSANPLPNLDFIPELPVYVRRIGEVPYRAPGSPELARCVVRAFRDPEVRIAQLRNHGQVVIGDNPAQLVERAAFFELASRIYLMAGKHGNLRRFDAMELSLLVTY